MKLTRRDSNSSHGGKKGKHQPSEPAEAILKRRHWCYISLGSESMLSFGRKTCTFLSLPTRVGGDGAEHHANEPRERERPTWFGHEAIYRGIGTNAVAKRCTIAHCGRCRQATAKWSVSLDRESRGAYYDMP